MREKTRVEKNIGLAQKWAWIFWKKYHWITDDFDDYLQSAYEGLCMADAECKDEDFIDVAFRKINTCVKSYIAKEHGREYKKSRDTGKEIRIDRFDPLTHIIEDERNDDHKLLCTRLDMDTVMPLLSDHERKIYTHLMSGYSQVEIAEKLSRTRQAIDLSVERIEQKIMSVLGKKYT